MDLTTSPLTTAITYEILVTHPTKAKITNEFIFEKISSYLLGNIKITANKLATIKVRVLADIG